MSSAIELPPLPVSGHRPGLRHGLSKIQLPPVQHSGPVSSQPNRQGWFSRWYGHAAEMSVYK